MIADAPIKIFVKSIESSGVPPASPNAVDCMVSEDIFECSGTLVDSPPWAAALVGGAKAISS